MCQLIWIFLYGLVFELVLMRSMWLCEKHDGIFGKCDLFHFVLKFINQFVVEVEVSYLYLFLYVKGNTNT